MLIWGGGFTLSGKVGSPGVHEKGGSQGVHKKGGSQGVHKKGGSREPCEPPGYGPVMVCLTVLHGGVCHRTSTPHKKWE